MTGLLTPAVHKALGPARAARLEADLEKRVHNHLAALDAQHTLHKTELAELIRGWNERLDAVERRENHAA